MNKLLDEEPSTDQITLEALIKARGAFDKYLEDYGYDPAFWDTRFTAWQVDSSLSQRLRKFEIEGEVKDE